VWNKYITYLLTYLLIYLFEIDVSVYTVIICIGSNGILSNSSLRPFWALLSPHCPLFDA